MQYVKKKVLSFGKVFGGKSRYARQYIEIFPEASKYSHYIEPFAGGAGICLNKVPSKHETISDIDKNIYNVLHSLKFHGEKVQRELTTTYKDYSEKTFKRAQSRMNTQEIAFKRAAAQIAANRMSRGGTYQSFATSNRLRGGQMGDKNAYEKYIYSGINLTICRLQVINILNECSFVMLDKYNNKDTLYYLDPPYLQETRVSKKVYDHEFSEDKHLKLLEVITDPAFKAKVFLSGYHSKLYEEALKGWKVHEFNRHCDAGQTKIKSERIEVVWEN